MSDASASALTVEPTAKPAVSAAARLFPLLCLVVVVLVIAGLAELAPTVVQRRITRLKRASSKPVARCSVQRLSHTIHCRGAHVCE